MNVENTATCACLARTIELPGNRSVGMVVIKQTFVLGSEGLELAPVQEEVFSADKTIAGRFYSSDILYPKKGVDLVVIGDCVAPAGTKATTLPVSIRLGTLQVDYQVSGDRHWESDEDKEPQTLSLDELLDRVSEIENPPPLTLPDPGSFPQPPESDGTEDEEGAPAEDEEEKTFRMSEPLPFSRIPLDWKHAYGGSSNYQSSFQDNPEGKGFVQASVTEGQPTDVTGVPLPNVEYADQLIQRWTDQPRVAGCGFYPMLWGLRLRAGLKVRGLKPPCILEEMFNQAHPDLNLLEFPQNQTLTITNMSQPSPLTIRIQKPQIAAEIEREGVRRVLSIQWDLICLSVERRQLVIVGRTLFKYSPDTDYTQTVRLSAGAGD